MIEGTPQDWGAPEDHKEWRASQKEALEAILNAKTRDIIIELPTGGGKTFLATAMARDNPVTAMVATRDLQVEQYRDKYGFFSIWGKSNYLCTDQKRKTRWKEYYNLDATADACHPMTCSDCPYLVAKRESLASKKLVTNYHYAWYSRETIARHGSKSVLFFDEAHNLALTMIPNLMTLYVSAKQKREYGLPDFPSVSGTTYIAGNTAKSWLRQSHGILKTLVDNFDSGDGEAYLRALRLEKKLANMQMYLGTGDFHVDSTRLMGGHLRIRPISPRRYAPLLTCDTSDVVKPCKRIYMSATIGSPEMLAQELDIDKFEFYTFQHNIPEANRPVYWVDDAPGLNYKSSERDYDKQANIIATICKQHDGERILILTTRWQHATDLSKRLSKLGLRDRVYLPDRDVDRIEQIARITKRESLDMIVISPSLWEGISLNDELCRAIIIAKIPFQDRKDPVVSARLKQPGGLQWDKWVAALKVVQGCGRGVRHERDMATAYIVDKNWKMVSDMAPAWFKAK